VGFLGKFYVFAAIIEKGPSLYWYAVVGAVNAAIGAFYYARVMRAMIIDPGGDEREAMKLPLADQVALVGFALANFLPLLFWGRLDEWARGSLALYAGL
jgi:NADH-quinone oxidoreductase subunit N